MVTRGKAIEVLAYVAGVVDSDGHISIERSRGTTQRRTNVRYEAAVVVTNTNKALIDWLHDEFGGSVQVRQRAQAHHKQGYNWKISEREAAEFCREILPFMRVKRDRAALLIEMKDGWVTSHNGPGTRVSDTEIARRESIYQRIRGLTDDRRPQRLSEMAPRTGEAIVWPAVKAAEAEGTETIGPVQRGEVMPRFDILLHSEGRTTGYYLGGKLKSLPAPDVVEADE